MEKYLGFAWLVMTITAWISFGRASWEWAQYFERGMLELTIFWFVISLALFGLGMRFRNLDRK